MLKFRLTDLAPMIAHCLKEGMTFTRPYTKDKIPPCLNLVHDQGVYLMAGSDKGMDKDSKGRVVYAEGLNPNVDTDWYEDARCEVGGDDFAEAIDLAFIDKAFTDGKIWLKFRFTKTRYTMSATMR